MKKILAFLLCFCMLSVSASAMSLGLDIGSTAVDVGRDGAVEQLQVETAPFTVDGRTMVPVRVIAESFGAQVGWDESTKTVSIKADATDISLVLDSAQATVNGEARTLYVPATEVGGRTFVPLRFISEALGYNVKYFPSTEQIYITDSPIVMQTKYRFVTLEEIEFLYCIFQTLLDAGEKITESTYSAYEEQLLTNVLDIYWNYLSICDYIVYANGGFTPEEIAEIELVVRDGGAEVLAMGYVGCAATSFFEISMAMNEQLSRFVSAAEMEEIQKTYASENYCAKHILIPTVNLQNGVALSAEEITAAKQLSEDLYQQILGGADFDALMQQYSQDGGLKANPDGYVFKAGEMVEAFYNGVVALEIGAVGAPVESPFGYHIIKRMPLPEMDEKMMSSYMQTYATATVERIYAENPPQMVMPVETLLTHFQNIVK